MNPDSNRPGDPDKTAEDDQGFRNTSRDVPVQAGVEMPSQRDEGTLTHRPSGVAPLAEGETVRRFRLTVIEGPGAGQVRESSDDRCQVGSHPLNDLVIDDPTVSRFHCEIRIEAGGAVVSDLRSRNGTLVDGVQVREAFLRGGSLLRLGRAVVRFELVAERNRRPLPPATRFGSLVGASLAMRQTIALLERAANSDVTVLLEGETGTGKGKAAEALHKASARKDAPLVVVDCGAIPANLLESELFGHEKGSFTGADARRIGAFEEASGGTLFLDEIGELPSDLQPKLLRALENKEIRRVGSNRFLPVNLRVIAATNRDLRAEVNAGRFRSDLYFRLAVVKIHIPPLRGRPEDIPGLVEEFLRQMATAPEAGARLLSPAFLETLARGAWPGNVRELRNYIERCLVFDDDAGPAGGEDPGRGGASGELLAGATVDPAGILPYAEARKRAQDGFERQYLAMLMRAFQGKVAQAAQAAGVDRVYLYRLLRRQGMKPAP
jgi:two-component system, NtrC family, response regulator GlrR